MLLLTFLYSQIFVQGLVNFFIQRNADCVRDGLALTNGQKGMSSGNAFLLHSLHAAAVRTVKYVEVRQPLKVLDVPNKLHRGTTMRACRSNGLVSVGHG